MSYDLYLARVPSGFDPQAVMEDALAREEEQEEINPGAPDPAKEVRKHALAQALMAADPGLTISPFDYAEIARFSGISEAEARVRYRHLELNGPGDGPGIQITLYDDTASVTLPYWHEADAAKQIWRKAWAYLRVLEREGGFRTYDPQREQVLDLSTGADALVDEYGHGVEHVHRLVSPGGDMSPDAPADPDGKPWWKFWER